MARRSRRPSMRRCSARRAKRASSAISAGSATSRSCRRRRRRARFDCGPANALLDEWATRHLGKPYDEGGKRRARHRPRAAARRAARRVFAAPPPKSTGRDLFNPAWLDAKLAAFAQVTPEDAGDLPRSRPCRSHARSRSTQRAARPVRAAAAHAIRCAARRARNAARGRRAGHGRYDGRARRAASRSRRRFACGRVPLHRAPARQSRDGHGRGRHWRASIVMHGEGTGHEAPFLFRRTGSDLPCQTENDEPHPQVVLAFGF